MTDEAKSTKEPMKCDFCDAVAIHLAGIVQGSGRIWALCPKHLKRAMRPPKAKEEGR